MTDEGLLLPDLSGEYTSEFNRMKYSIFSSARPKTILGLEVSCLNITKLCRLLQESFRNGRPFPIEPLLVKAAEGQIEVSTAESLLIFQDVFKNTPPYSNYHEVKQEAKKAALLNFMKSAKLKQTHPQVFQKGFRALLDQINAKEKLISSVITGKPMPGKNIVSPSADLSYETWAKKQGLPKLDTDMFPDLYPRYISEWQEEYGQGRSEEDMKAFAKANVDVLTAYYTKVSNRKGGLDAEHEGEIAKMYQRSQDNVEAIESKNKQITKLRADLKRNQELNKSIQATKTTIVSELETKKSAGTLDKIKAQISETKAKISLNTPEIEKLQADIQAERAKAKKGGGCGCQLI